MQKFRVHSGTAAPLAISNVDTDQIIPSEFLKRITRTGFEDGLFAEWRREPDFILNLPEYKGFSILVAGDNFGCGSSREHAVWAIQDYGIKVVIAPSFADIFRGNSGNSGLLVAETDVQFVNQLWTALEANPRTLVTVDLEARIVSFEGKSAPFVIDDHTRHLLLNGLDEIQNTLSHADEIIIFEGSRPSWRPVVGQ